MPIYEYECQECQKRFDEFKTISEYTDNPKSEPCEACGGTNTSRVISPSAVIADIDDYRSTITGERIHGRAHHKAHLKRHGYEEIGTDNIDEAKKEFHRPPQDDKKDRLEAAKHAYEQLSN